MAQQRNSKYLNSDGEFIGGNHGFSVPVFDDEEITLDNFRKKSAEQSALSGEKKSPSAERSKRPNTAEDKVRKMILSRAKEQQRYSKLNSASERKKSAPQHVLYHIPRFAEEEDEVTPPAKSRSSYSAPPPKKQSSSYSKSKSRKKNKKSNQRPTLLSLLGFITAVIIFAAAIYYLIMGAVLSGINRETIPASRPDSPVADMQTVPMQQSSQVKNILVLGLDDEGSGTSRSDTIMLISIDGRTNTLRMCSILRDNWVEIPEVGKRKINAAYAYGGALLAVKTVESNFRIKIDNYVSIDIDSLTHIIDLLGGVDIEISESEAKYLNKHSFSEIKAEAGLQHMDGKLAVCYARIRKLDSDFGRTSRQRTLINAMMSKCKNDFSLPQMLSLAGDIAPYLTTDMSPSQLATLALNAAPTLINEPAQLTIPAEGLYEYGYAGDQSVIYLDLEKNVALLHQFLYGTSHQAQEDTNAAE